MATSRLVDSLHKFQSRFDVFESNRARVRQIYEDTQKAWLGCRRLRSSSSRQSSASDSTPEQLASQNSADARGVFETEMANVVRLLDEKPTIVFVGQLKSGKSTLANLVLQQHILPSDEGPCTARMVKLKFSEESKGEPGKAYLQLRRADGTTIGGQTEVNTVVDSKGFHRLVIPQNVVSVGRETGFGERSREFRVEGGEATENAAWVEIYCSHPLLQFIQVIDSPGKGENEQLDQLVNETVAHGLVQTLVYVIDGCRGLTTKVRASTFLYYHWSPKCTCMVDTR